MSPSTISDEQFQRILYLVGTGVPVLRALKEISRGWKTFIRELRSDPTKYAQYRYAVKWGKRKNYSKLDIEGALADVSASSISFQAALAKRGIPRWRYQRIIRWTRTDPELREAYLSAKRAQQLLLVEKTKHQFWAQEDAGSTQAGRRAIHRAWNAVDRLRPDHLRKIDAAARRAEQAAAAPRTARLARAHKRAKKRREKKA